MNIVKLKDIKSTQKFLAFLYTNNEKIEREIKETIPFTVAVCFKIKYNFSVFHFNFYLLLIFSFSSFTFIIRRGLCYPPSPKFYLQYQLSYCPWNFVCLKMLFFLLIYLDSKVCDPISDCFSFSIHSFPFPNKPLFFPTEIPCNIFPPCVKK